MSSEMSSEKRFNQLIDTVLSKSFIGWDFAFVDGRIVEAQSFHGCTKASLKVESQDRVSC